MFNITFEKIPNQKKDIGRVIDIMKCTSCTTCDYMNCKNYAVKTKVKKYSVDEWFDEYNVELHMRGWGIDILNNFFDCLAPEFPKNLYWESNSEIFTDKISNIGFFTFTKSGKQKKVGSVDVKNLNININKATKAQVKHMEDILNLIKQVEARLIDDVIE